MRVPIRSKFASELTCQAALHRLPAANRDRSDRIPGGPTAVSKLASGLVDESPVLLQDIRTAIANADSKTIQRGARTLKGSAATFGAQCVVTAASQLEEIGGFKELARTADAFVHPEQKVASRIKVIETNGN